MAPLVSILIPAYNTERWINETLSSALGQTWPSIEIIVVDDGSRDNTLAVARRYESAKVKVVTQENRGVCYARNRALGLAQGDYIQWLDADDILDPNKISLQMRRGDCSPNDRVMLTSAFGSFYFRREKAKFRPNSLWQDLKPIEWILHKFTDNVWLNPTSWLVSRKLTELAGPWDERLSSSGDDDGEYVCRVVSSSETVNFVADAKCYYRIGNLGSLNWRSSKSLEPLLLSLRLSIDHLRSLEDSERTRAASVMLLKNWSGYFYPDRNGMFHEIESAVRELGGTLEPPNLHWKYSSIQKVFGWEVASMAANTWRKSKLQIMKKWDKLLYNVSGSSQQTDNHRE
jgi:glycosyltransferase involved in cell wall biosynthesis